MNKSDDTQEPPVPWSPELEAFINWDYEWNCWVNRAGTDRTSVAPTTPATRIFVFMRGMRHLQKEDPSVLREFANKMPPMPQPWPDSLPPYDCDHIRAVLKGRRAGFPKELVPELVADIRTQADRLRALADEIEYRGTA